MFPSLFKRLAGRSSAQTGKGHDLVDLTSLEEKIKEFDARPVRNPQSKEAKKYVVDQLLARGFKKTEIAERLQISRKTVYNILNS